MKSEQIKTVWRFGYFKLFWDDGFEKPYQRFVTIENYEYIQIFWRFYWRVS